MGWRRTEDVQRDVVLSSCYMPERSFRVPVGGEETEQVRELRGEVRSEGRRVSRNRRVRNLWSQTVRKTGCWQENSTRGFRRYWWINRHREVPQRSEPTYTVTDGSPGVPPRFRWYLSCLGFVLRPTHQSCKWPGYTRFGPWVGTEERGEWGVGQKVVHRGTTETCHRVWTDGDTGDETRLGGRRQRTWWYHRRVVGVDWEGESFYTLLGSLERTGDEGGEATGEVTRVTFFL